MNTDRRCRPSCVLTVDAGPGSGQPLSVEICCEAPLEHVPVLGVGLQELGEPIGPLLHEIGYLVPPGCGPEEVCELYDDPPGAASGPASRPAQSLVADEGAGERNLGCPADRRRPRRSEER